MYVYIETDGGKRVERVGDFTTCNIRQSLNFGVISSRKPSFFQEPKNHIETKPEDIKPKKPNGEKELNQK
jgi:hypothetical protein